MITKETTARRLRTIRRGLEKGKLDALLVIDRANTYYVSGFECSNSIIVITATGAWFLTDFRYMEKAGRDLGGRFEIRAMTQGGIGEIKDLLKGLRVRKVGFEGSIPFAQFRQLEKAAGTGKLVEASAILGQSRAVKDDAEIQLVAENQRMNERLLRAALERVELGDSEIDVRRGIRAEMLALGVEEAFDSIIATGANSSLPHAVPSRRKIARNGFLLFDMGVKRHHYHSDMTRTYCVAGDRVHSKLREVYDVVLEAQLRAMAKVKAGAACRVVDAAARDFISSCGYGENFGHGLGHGVGLEIHEGPRLNPRSEELLEEGMVITIEPGIYLPGVGGVRIEDLLVVTRNGYRNLTAMPKRWKTLKL
ncbi:MAG: Xaa-Pro peptidase family protein [Candidatus Sumerlaeaceae bacterium]|nr:Xaa-Pro peptidase family protein [Candidatus Sumerlaeaceae bacterium]